MDIQHIISMFEEKIAKNYEEMVVLKGNLPIKFSWLCNEYNWFISFLLYFNKLLGPGYKKVMLNIKILMLVTSNNKGKSTFGLK